MSTDRAMQAIEIASQLIVREEGYAPCAYPDPRSPMARALGVKRAWQVGQTGVIPADVAQLSGAPWTIGFGDTGPHVKRGLRWTRDDAVAALASRLVQFQRDVRRTWPGIDKLDARAEAALIDLAYNRGTDLERRADDPIDRRREMRELVPAVTAGDYAAMAALVDAMCRIWVGHALDGLIKRRKAEAALIRSCLPGVKTA